MVMVMVSGPQVEVELTRLEHLAIELYPGELVWLVQQWRAVPGRHHPRVAVLLESARSEQVPEQSARLVTAQHLRDHDGSGQQLGADPAQQLVRAATPTRSEREGVAPGDVPCPRTKTRGWDQ